MPTNGVDSHLVNAAQIQAATRQKLAVLGDAFTCTDARFVSYRRSDTDPEVTDQWYVASQLWADAFLLDGLSAPPTPEWSFDDARCYLNKGFVFLDRLWDYTSSGYFPESNPAGTTVKTGPRYSDDNLVDRPGAAANRADYPRPARAAAVRPRGRTRG